MRNVRTLYLQAQEFLQSSAASGPPSGEALASEPLPAEPLPAEPLTAEALHRRHYDEVFRYVSRRVPRREDAEDVTAEVFAAAFADLPRCRQGRAYLWLLGVARRKIIDLNRRKRARRETLAAEVGGPGEGLEAEPAIGAPAPVGPEAQILAAERLQAIRRLVEGLKEEQREALLLQQVERLSQAEIARVMGKSPAAVNSLLQRARQTLYARGRAYFVDSPDLPGSEVTR